MIDRLLGWLLFLPVPAVLYVFTAAPFGEARSIAMGVALMVTHRLYARPWALRRATERCLWCASSAAEQTLTLGEPLGTTNWGACLHHRAPLSRFLGFAAKYGRLIRIGILGSIAVLVTIGLFRHDIASALFRIGVAITVLPLGYWAPHFGTSFEGKLPFPVHIQALIGTLWVTWLFRIVGTIWLVLGTWRLL